MTFPKNEETREELFSFLGIQGGTCHQLPNLLRTAKYDREGTYGISFYLGDSLSTNDFIIIITNHEFGNRVEVFKKYKFVAGNGYSDYPLTGEQLAYSKTTQLDIPKSYTDWNNPIEISGELKNWFVEFATRNN